MNLEISNLLDLCHTLAGDYLKQFQYPWQALDGIKELILTLGAGLSPEEYDQPQPNVWVHKTAGCALHHRSGDRGAALRLYPGLCPGGSSLRGGQLGGTEKRHPL